MFKLRLRPDGFNQFDTAHFGQSQVEQDGRGTETADQFERLLTVTRGCYLKMFGQENAAINSCDESVVLDNQDFIHGCFERRDQPAEPDTPRGTSESVEIRR